MEGKYVKKFYEKGLHIPNQLERIVFRRHYDLASEKRIVLTDADRLNGGMVLDKRQELLALKAQGVKIDQKDFLAKKKALIEKLLFNEGKEVKHEKKAFILVGPPASGKSTIVENYLSDQGAVLMDHDIVKAGLPYGKVFGSKFVKKETKEIFQEAFDKSLNDGSNVIFPTGPSKEEFTDVIGKLLDNGYEVNIANIKVKTKTSLDRVSGRLKTTGRFTEPTKIQDENKQSGSVISSALKKYKEGIAGYVEIDNNGGAPKILKVKGNNFLEK